MLRTMLKSKIHRAVITEANLNYRGSITIDRALMVEADLLENERVDVFNIYNGARFQTYCIPAGPDSGIICLNGAAARLGQPGDLIIVLSYALVNEEEARTLRPRVIFVDEKNRMVQCSAGVDR